jgi:phospholipid/cholesterol/gamma-HCH transport system substrate-binding protein
MNARFVNGSRRRRDTEPARRTLLKGLAVGAVFVAFGWLAVTAYNGVPGRQYTAMYADVPEVGNLLEHDQVRIAGVRVGQVQARAIRPGGGTRLTLQLEPGVTLPADTRIALRASGLLGARYVQLVPGTSDRTLAAGSTIRAPRTALSYGVPEALDIFDAQTRGGLGTAVRELGTGLLGHSSRLNDAVRLSGAQMHRFQLLADSVLRQPGAARRLLPSLDRAVTPLDAARHDAAGLFKPAAVALQPFVDRRQAVRDTLAQAPAALRAANVGLTDGRRLLDATRALAISASRTLPYAPAGLRSATALLRESHTPLRRAASLLHDAGRAVPAALRITGSLSPVLRPLRETLGDLVPMVTRLGRYGCDIENFGVVFRSMTGFGGTGEGPIGPAMAFRLQAIPPSAEEITGSKDDSGLIQRDGYPEACKYLAKPYPGSAPRVGNGARP